MPPDLPYQAVLIDWDGTVAQTLRVWMQCYLQACAEWDLHPSQEQVAAQFGSWRGVLDLGVSEHTFDAYWQRMDVLLGQRLPQVELYPHALQALQAARAAGLATALVTTGRRAIWGPSFNRHGLDPLFDTVISGDDVTHHKPHPEPLLLALDRLGVPPQQAVMIGDSDKDLGAAQAAGMDAVLFYPADHQQFYPLEDLRAYDPRFVCSTWEDIALTLLSTPEETIHDGA